MEFRLLGDIEARIDGQPVSIGYTQLRCVLAVLLVDANRIVSVDQLVDRVWGIRPPPRRPRAAVQHSISLLRTALSDLPVPISWRATGYELRVDPATIDLHRFHALINQTRAAPDDAHAELLFAKALALWNGEPLAGLDTPWFNSVRAELVAQRDAARLDLTDVRLRSGQDAALLAELSEWVADHPLDERRAGQYMLALYRCGRGADALAHYQTIRAHLAELLGTDPGPPLLRLRHQILVADPALAAPAGANSPTNR